MPYLFARYKPTSARHWPAEKARRSSDTDQFPAAPYPATVLAENATRFIRNWTTSSGTGERLMPDGEIHRSPILLTLSTLCREEI